MTVSFFHIQFTPDAFNLKIFVLYISKSREFNVNFENKKIKCQTKYTTEAYSIKVPVKPL